MIKPIKIIEVKPFEITCEFNNGEVKKIYMEQVFKKQANTMGDLIDFPKLFSDTRSYNKS